MNKATQCLRQTTTKKKKKQKQKQQKPNKQKNQPKQNQKQKHKKKKSVRVLVVASLPAHFPHLLHDDVRLHPRARAEARLAVTAMDVAPHARTLFVLVRQTELLAARTLKHTHAGDLSRRGVHGQYTTSVVGARRAGLRVIKSGHSSRERQVRWS